MFIIFRWQFRKLAANWVCVHLQRDGVYTTTTPARGDLGFDPTKLATSSPTSEQGYVLVCSCLHFAVQVGKGSREEH